MTLDGGNARTAALSGAALIGFAANSILCRLALGPRQIDAASYTGIRLLSDALGIAGVLILGGVAIVLKVRAPGNGQKMASRTPARRNRCT